jgi:hypothetical protein
MVQDFLVILLVRMELVLQPEYMPYFHTQILSDSVLDKIQYILCLLIATTLGTDSEVLI